MSHVCDIRVVVYMSLCVCLLRVGCRQLRDGGGGDYDYDDATDAAVMRRIHTHSHTTIVQ